MKHYFLMLTLSLMSFMPLQLAQAASERYTIDPDHSTLAFSVNHLGFANISGKFAHFSGLFDYDRNDPSNSRVTIKTTTSSLNTVHTGRDKHLKSPDFFNVNEFPEMAFESIKMTAVDKKQSTINGYLTLLGKTQLISLDVRHNNEGNNPFLPQNYVVGFSARGTIKRSDFGMKFALPAISDEVELIIEIEGIQQTR